MATIPLTVTIRDYRYTSSITIPSLSSGTPSIGNPPPAPPLPPPPPTQELRVVKILPDNERKLPDANTGETVKITATIICKTNEIISKPRDTAYLIVDGAIADRKTIENGTVTFEWVASSVPSPIHTICVKVDPSTSCKSPGQDCKRITVSPTQLGIAEQLQKERSSASEQKRLLEEARSKLRQDIIGAELEIPGSELLYTQPTIPTSPVISPSIITQPTQPVPLPELGDITIIGLPPPINIITADLPIYVYLDGNNIGRLYELPKTIMDVAVGTHTIYARAGDITTPEKTAIVRNNEITTISL